MTALYDLVVVGGGIHGAGVAQAAAAAGHSVLLLERNALAAGTSGRSSKLIHGGLRYLETAQLRLVHEALAERERLLRLAPELVTLRAHHIPVYADTKRRPWQLRAGLGLYALLGGLGPRVRFRRLRPDEWSTLDGLRTDGLQAVFRYFDAQTDDAALTRAVASSAERLGAELAIPAAFKGARFAEARWHVHYRQGEQPRTCLAEVLVNAAGPWVDRVLDTVRPAPRRLPVALVQGAHLVLDGAPARGVYYVEAPRDHRAVFVMPWRETRTLLGTTELPYEGDPAAVAPRPEEREYLLETLAHYFPRRAGARVLEAFAGLRVLPAGAGAPSRRSRETRLVLDPASGERLLTVYGGKLTTYRATAERALRLLRPRLPRRRARADTRELALPPAKDDHG